MRIDKKKVFALFVLTLLTVSLFLVNMNGPLSAAPSPLPMYWKANFTDYAPSGMPDFDQRQDAWVPFWYPAFNWSWCAPVAVANSLWWYDSKHENNTIPPPTRIDNFPLVGNYGPWDDHDPQNVQPFIRHLAYLMDTDGNRTGNLHFATKVEDMETGLTQCLSWSGVNPQGDVNGDGIVDQTDYNIVNASYGAKPGNVSWNMAADIWPVTTGWPNVTMADNVVNIKDLALVTANMNSTGMFYEITVPMPDFYFIEEEVERSEDVVLTLGFYYEINATHYYRDDEQYPYGHAVTVSGVNSTSMKIAISDPAIDAFELGLTAGRSPVPHPHMPPEPPYITHNNASLVSHDIYNVTFNLVMGMWELRGYPGYPTPPWHVLIENAVITSPFENHDVAVTDITPHKTLVCQGYNCRINATVENQGNFTETFNVTTYHTYYNATVFSEGFESGAFTGWDFYYSFPNGTQSGTAYYDGTPVGDWDSSIVSGASALSGNYSARLFADSYASYPPWRVDAAINRTVSRKGTTVLKATFKFDQITDPQNRKGCAVFYITVINALKTSEFISYGFDNEVLTYGDISYNVSPGDLVNFERDVAADYFNKYGKTLPQKVIIRFQVAADYAEAGPIPIPGRQTIEVRLDDIALVAPSTPIETKTVTLTSGNFTTITFTWNTTSVCKGTYTISANATIVPGEIDTGDNSFTDGTVRVNMVGDVAPVYDLVDIVDIVTVAIVFGSQRGDPNYNPNADINCDGIIDIVDIVIIAIHFGETDP